MILVDPIIEKRNQEMVKMKAEGWSINQIGKYFNLTKQSISKTLQKMKKQEEEKAGKLS